MSIWHGQIYLSPTITTAGDSGWIKWPMIGFDASSLTLIPSGVVSAETLDVDLDLAYDSLGTGSSKYLDFTQITNTNAEEDLMLPSEKPAKGATITGAQTRGPVPPYFKLTWAGTLTGATLKLMGILKG